VRVLSVMSAMFWVLLDVRVYFSYTFFVPETSPLDT